MAAHVKVIVGLIVVGIAAAVIFESTREKPQRPPPAQPAGPPTDAQYVAATPQEILAAVGSARRPNQQTAADAFIGQWNGPEGWEGQCEKLSTDRGRPVLHLRCLSATMVGGGYWIIAVVGDDHGVKVNDNVRVQGRIEGVAVRAAAADVVSTIRLEDARVIR